MTNQTISRLSDQSGFSLVAESVTYSTMEIEQAQFVGTMRIISANVDPVVVAPPGVYRVIDGELFRISPSAPPQMVADASSD